MILAVVLFILTYALLLIFPKYRAYIALGSAFVFVATGILPGAKLLFAVDWNVLLMIGGTMGIVSLFTASKMPSLLADLMIKKMPDVRWAVIALAILAGLISAFVDNVATVLMVAPVAVTVCKKLEISPVKSIVAIAVASNLQGAATLVGDTTSILLGGYAELNFLDFFFYRGQFGMFWIVQISALAAALVLVWLFRKDNQKIAIDGKTEVRDYFPTVLLLGMILLLILASFCPYKLKIGQTDITNGTICVALFVIGLAREVIKTKKPDAVKSSLREIDFFTLALLGGLFIVIAGITEAGVINVISSFFVKISNNNVFVIYSVLVWASVLLSAFIDNIPYVATMLPVAQGIAAIMGIDPVILYFGLLSGATLGGNFTPIGASANITALGILRKNGHEVKAWDFMKISIPFTLSAVTVGYLLIWLIYT